ncbi:MAG TPA: fluoride efflux transporter CrcB [Bacteroidota bacterium]|nr:fluoride efflux transporter CrcB [Bacteroidota bacterium]
MTRYLFIFLGGGLGSVCRYAVQGLVYRIFPSLFPLGTLLVNITGSFLIGFCMAAFEERFLINPSLRLFLTIGILGGYTTFSSFSYETVALLRDGQLFDGGVNIAASFLFCLTAAYGGILAGKMV